MKLNFKLFLATTVSLAAASSLRGAQPIEDLDDTPAETTQERSLQESDDGRLVVCDEDGEFAPNPGKFYNIIGQQTGKFAFMNGPDGGSLPDFNIQLRENTAGESESQWRFVPQGDRWIIRSRSNALDWGSINAPGAPGPPGTLIGDHDLRQYAVGIAPLVIRTDRDSSLDFNIQCTNDGKGIIIDHNGVTFPREITETLGQVEMGPRTTVETTTTKPGTALNSNTCIPNNTPERQNCAVIFGAGFVETSRRGCSFSSGFLGLGSTSGKILECRRKTLGPAGSPQPWTVKEATTRRRRGTPKEAGPVVVGSIDAPGLQVGDSLAGQAAETAVILASTTLAVAIPTILGSAFPILGGVLSAFVAFGGGQIGGLFNQGPSLQEFVLEREAALTEAIEETLLDLAEDLTKQTEKMLALGLVSNDVARSMNELDTRRNWYLLSYPADKYLKIESGDLEEVQDLAKTLKAQSDQLNVEISGFFGNDAATFKVDDPSAKDKVLRASLGADFFKVSSMQLFNMLREALLLTAFADPTGFSCGDLVNTSFDLDSLQTKYTNLFQDTQQMMLEFATNGVQVEDRRRVVDGINGLVYNVPEGQIQNPSTQGAFSQMVNRMRSEIEIDVENFSFDVSRQVEFLSTYVEDTIAMCEAVRNDRLIKYSFATSTLATEVPDDWVDPTIVVVEDAVGFPDLLGVPVEDAIGAIQHTHPDLEVIVKEFSPLSFAASMIGVHSSSVDASTITVWAEDGTVALVPTVGL